MPHCIPVLVLSLLVTSTIVAQDEERKVTPAPPNHALLRHAWGGSYFVPINLYEESRTLQTEIESLQGAVDSDETIPSEVLARLDSLTRKLATLRENIEKEQVFVSPVNVFEQVDTYEFDIADTRRIVVLADQIRIESHEHPVIRCVLKKQIIAESQPDDAEFDKLFVKHEIGIPEQYVGTTDAQRQTRESEFMASPEGQKLTPEQKAFRLELARQIDQSYDRYRAFQGESTHILNVRGLDTGERKWVSINVGSEGGSSSFGGTWDRRAELTIQIPRGASTAVIGCGVGVHVAGYDGQLLLSSQRQNEYEYNGTFLVEKMTGELSAFGVSFSSIRNITGSVRLDSRGERRNGGTHHSNGYRRVYVDLAGSTSIRGVTGDLTIRSLHSRLDVSDVSGQLDIENKFGPTTIALSAPQGTEQRHRIVSSTGKIRMTAPKSALSSTQWFLCTQLGDLRVNVERDLLDETRFSNNHSGSWIAMHTPLPQDDHSALFLKFERPELILNNSDRSAGIDVLTLTGRILLEAK